MKGAAWFKLILIKGGGGGGGGGVIKGRRGLHNPELEFEGYRKLLDGLYRVV